MRVRTTAGFVACALLALCCACGVPGAPQPPSLKLPRPVRDLRAQRKGDQVTLTWTAPRVTTDQEGIKQLGASRICRSLGAEPATTCTPVGEVTGAQAAPANPVTFVDTLPVALQQQNPSGFVSYAVETENAGGRSAGLSNSATVPAAPTLPPPDRLVPRLTAEGPVLGWTVPSDQSGELLRPEAMKAKEAVSYGYRLYRRDKDKPNAAPVRVPVEDAFASPELAQPNLNVRDRSAEWEKTYVYWATVVTTVRAGGQTAEVEGGDSPAVEVLAHDVFPPAVPGGAQAVYSPIPGQAGFIDLTWVPDTEADLAGYNVYRHEEGAAPVKINSELVKTPAFRDRNVVTGHRYFYSISAVDLRGNESQRSSEASEVAPQ
ncbi:MAG TPA: hypothetical protein VLT85_01930 [Terriglobales bacterium]|nr:hypothetical protein [Terriglobales bacterium]